MEVLTRQETADFLKIPLRTLDYLVCTNQIPFSRISKRGVRFDKQRLKDWFRKNEGREYRIHRKAATSK